MKCYDIKYKIPYNPTNPSGKGVMMVCGLCPESQVACKIKELEENWGAVILEIVKSDHDVLKAINEAMDKINRSKRW